MALQANSDLVLLNAPVTISPIFDLPSEVAFFHLLIPLCIKFPHLLTFNQVPAFYVGRVRSGGIATCYEVHGPGIEPRWKIFRTRTDRSWSPPGSSVPECKSAGAWLRPPFPIKLRDYGKSREISLLPFGPSRCVLLTLHCTCLHWVCYYSHDAGVLLRLQVCPIERGMSWLNVVPNSSSSYLFQNFPIFSHYLCGENGRKVM